MSSVTNNLIARAPCAGGGRRENVKDDYCNDDKGNMTTKNDNMTTTK